MKINNTEFIENNASENGGAIYQGNGTLTIENSIFKDNLAIGDGTFYNGYGGAIYKDDGYLKVNNSVFKNNNAAVGGGITIF